MPRPFHIRQIYLKDLSFQAPSGAAIFTQEWQPQIKVDMKTQHEAIPGNLTEVVLTMSIIATSAGRTAFMIEAIQAGIFQIAETSGPAYDRIVGALCPEVLLPYAREAIDNVLMKGRFPPLIIDPIDFEAQLGR
ncbi:MULTISPECIES: protein-export chaperone SecB [Asticcacaulis]|uniref:protein-export chaperone SecB n=1 Tax=Asticcacaulis TaxID=76890 RepID=UPI001AE72EFE|nr:protein-export chaperone SecB [Asticcacaulis sp. BE141]MBP2157918.1 preprotein translocase subunit SecB [Asticcacaulis solisilvae]MDR6798963.1 preprotein translocase subunit SecB [Asticcacaulis sp. BE141]